MAALIARQAIVDEHRAVFGYELYDRTTAVEAHTAASDAALLFNALSHGGAEALVGQKVVFINCTHESLASGHLELVHPDKVVLEIPTLADNATAEAIDTALAHFDTLIKRGFKLAFNQNVLRRAYVQWLPRAAYIKLDMQSFKPEMAPALVKFAKANSTAQLVAEKVETAEQFQLMLDLGVKYFQGFWFAQPSLVQTKTLRPSQAIILQLINLIRNACEAMADSPVRRLSVISRSDSPGFVRVTVSDTGSGISPAVASQLFSAFVSTKSQGMGLGLSICRTIVEANNGRIWMEQRPDGGTDFHFTLVKADGSEAHDG